MDSLKVSFASLFNYGLSLAEVSLILQCLVAVMTIIYLGYKIKNIREIQMLKKVVLAKIIDKAKDHIVEEYQDEFISYIQSDELKEELATKINKKLNLPFLNESQEQELLEKMIDWLTDVLEDLAKK